MPDVFISYSRDDRAIAQQYAEGLKREGLDVWWDAALRSGETFDTVIERALAEARAVVVLWSPRSVESRWVRAEATQADQNGTLAPVMIEPCKRPIIFELTHTTDLTHWTGDFADKAWSRFVDDVRAIMSHNRDAGVSSLAPPRPIAPPRRQSERRQIAFLNAVISDMSGSVPDVDPEDWQEISVQFQTQAADILSQHGGLAEPHRGDGVTGMFGAEQTLEDDAHRAVRAGLDIVELAKRLTKKGMPPLGARVGIDDGLMVVGVHGAPSYGAPVSQANHLQTGAPPGTVAISAAVASLAGGLLVLEPLGPRAFRVAGVAPTRTRFDISRARGLSPFVGRADDVETLDDALARADTGDGQVIGIVAEAGVGKSRLCFEFLERCRARGIRVIEGRAAAHARNVPYLAILEVFRSFFDIRTEDDDGVARSKIEVALTSFDANVGDGVALVSDFLGVPDPSRPPLQMDPDSRQRQLIGLMRHLIRTSGARQLSVTMIEDLQWLDPASAQFIEHMVEARQGARGLLILNYRPEYRADWMANAWCRQIALPHLGGPAVSEMLEDLLGPEAYVPTLTAMIQARTAGNPFFMEEVIQNLAETGHLAGERGAYKLVTPVDRIDVPSTVVAVVAARIDRLLPRDKHVLQVAAVIGKHFSEPLIRSVAELGEADLAESLASLRRSEFISELSLFPTVEYAFRHPLTQETALNSLIKDRRRHIHNAIAAAIEQQDSGRVDERAALMAHHWEEAGEPLKAAVRHRQAAEWVSLTDPNAAVWHWGRVRSLLGELVDDPAAAMLGVAACQHLLNLSWRFTSSPEEIKALFDEGLAFAKATGDRATELKVSMVYGRACCSTGDLATYIELATEIYDGALALGDISLIVNAALYLVDARVYTARFPQAVQLAEETLATYSDLVPRSEWIMGFNPYSALQFWRAASLIIMGRIPEGLAEFAHVRELLVRDETFEAAVYVSSWSATGYLTMRDVAQLQACVDTVDAACTAMGDPPTIVAHRQICLTLLHLACGRPVEAIETARAALAIHQQGERQHAGMSAMFIAESMLHAGDLDGSIAMARENIETCRFALRGNLEAQSHGILARALLRRDGAAALSKATAELAQAEALIASTGAGSLSPSLAEWRAEAAAVAGDRESQTQHLKSAADLYEAIGAPLQAERVRQSL